MQQFGKVCFYVRWVHYNHLAEQLLTILEFCAEHDIDPSASYYEDFAGNRGTHQSGLQELLGDIERFDTLILSGYHMVTIYYDQYLQFKNYLGKCGVNVVEINSMKRLKEVGER